jgi:hypothetical protein
MDVFFHIKQIMSELGFEKYSTEASELYFPDTSIKHTDFIDGDLHTGFYFLISNGEDFKGMTILSDNKVYKCTCNDQIPFIIPFKGKIVVSVPSLVPKADYTVQFIRVIPHKG